MALSAWKRQWIDKQKISEQPFSHFFFAIMHRLNRKLVTWLAQGVSRMNNYFHQGVTSERQILNKTWRHAKSVYCWNCRLARPANFVIAIKALTFGPWPVICDNRNIFPHWCPSLPIIPNFCFDTRIDFLKFLRKNPMGRYKVIVFSLAH